jgi:hypothetical protein
VEDVNPTPNLTTMDDDVVGVAVDIVVWILAPDDNIAGVVRIVVRNVPPHLTPLDVGLTTNHMYVMFHDIDMKANVQRPTNCWTMGYAIIGSLSKNWNMFSI